MIVCRTVLSFTVMRRREARVLVSVPTVLLELSTQLFSVPVNQTYREDDFRVDSHDAQIIASAKSYEQHTRLRNETRDEGPR